MRILSAIDAPLADEHVIGTDPPLRPELAGVWRRRSNPFTGRALSDRALTAEQEARAGVQRLRGQSVSAGIIAGLDLLAEPAGFGQAPDAAWVQVVPGSGLTRAGEDVVVAAPRRLRLAGLPVRARVDQLDAIAAGDDAGGTASSSGVLLPRRIGPMLGTLLGAPAAADLPRVALLVAEPVMATMLAGPRDDCPPDPRDDPYDDLQRIDGCQLVLDFWPAELAAYALPPPGALRRNRIAERVFTAEARFHAGAMHPWEGVGVPLALVAFAEDWALDFLDRAVVVRMGGQPRPRTALVPGRGDAPLWQARLAQLVEHLGALPDLAPATVHGALHHLPPVGVLPASLVDLATKRQFLFPPGFALSAAPVPLGELELVLRASAGLAPLDLETPEEVELLVPVPDRVYEPGLLLTAEVDPAFARAVARYTADRTGWLLRREAVRRRRDLLLDAITGERPVWPASDVTSAETLPDPAGRAPVGCTRVRRLPATAGQARAQAMLRAGSSLPMRKGDRLFLWLRAGAGVTGIALRVGANTSTSGAGGLASAVYWGAPAGLISPTSDPQLALRRQGDVPAVGAWTRLEAPASSRWDANGGTLDGLALDGLEVSAIGGTVEWGSVGRISADGMEATWIADDAPPGSELTETGRAGPGWTQFPVTTGEEPPAEDGYGTAESGGVREIVASTTFRARWTQPFLANEMQRLQETGLDRFIADAEARLAATNDRIDLGFVRAQADIYRLRQLVLGGDAAARLVTSPALAGIATRDESARARADDLAGYLKAAWQTSPARDPNEPLETRPKPRTPSDTIIGAGPGDAPVAFDPRSGGGILGAINQPLFTANLSFVNLRQTTTRTTSLAGLAAGFTRGAEAADIRGQLPLIGRVERTASIAERLAPPPSLEAQRYALEGKMALVAAVASLTGADGGEATGIALGDLPAPGFRFVEGRAATPTLADVIAGLEKPGDRATVDTDDLRDGAHEAQFFGAGASAVDNSIALLRHIEGRAALYSRLIAEAKALRTELAGRIADADARLRSIGVEVEEARHDLGVADALLAEETQRVAALNAKRQAVLASHVTAIAYRRARRADRALVTPTAPAVAGLVPEPAAACLDAHEEVPEEIRDYVALFREAPVAWFPHVARRLALLDRLEAARAALAASRMRAALAFIPAPLAPSAPRLLGVVHRVIAAQRAVLEPRRLEAVRLDLATVATLDLSGVRRLLNDRASLGDLASGEHNRPELARRASAELEDVARVAACLHATFGEAAPAIRLGWAELLSGFDEPAPLETLAGLPGWSELPIELRRRQQELVDWLFSRIARDIPRAEAAMNELVRICLLMAAHAPLDRVIPARLVASVTVRPGVRLDLALDIKVARVGMTALLRDAEARPVGTAVVEDLGEGIARARIVKGLTTSAVTLVAGLRVELTG
jgi:hypothetical protein